MPVLQVPYTPPGQPQDVLGSGSHPFHDAGTDFGLPCDLVQAPQQLKEQLLYLATGDHPDGTLSGMYGQPIFSPDGSLAAFLRQSWSQTRVRAATVWVVTSDGSQEPRRLASAPVIHRVIWHPESRFIAFLRVDEENKERVVSVVSLRTGEVHEVLDLSDTEDEVRLNHWSPDGRWIGFAQLQGTMEYWMVDHPLPCPRFPGGLAISIPGRVHTRWRGPSRRSHRVEP
jgi:hypothetical protein